MVVGYPTLPFIQSSTCFGVHLLIGSITKAMVSQSIRDERRTAQCGRHKTTCQSHLETRSGVAKSEGKPDVVGFILSIGAWPPAENSELDAVVQSTRAHTDTHTHAFLLFSLRFSLSLPPLVPSLSHSLALFLVPSRQPAAPRSVRSGFGGRTGDGATPPLPSFSSPLFSPSSPPRCSITRATTHNTDQGMVQRTPYREDLSRSPSLLALHTHVHIHNVGGVSGGWGNANSK